MKRERATALLEELLHRVTGDDWPVKLVQAVYVFGSYARGATEPADLDIAIDVNRQDERWRSHFIHSMSYGQDPYSILRQALRGRRRGVSILCERDGHDDVPMTPLWQRGDSLEAALKRVAAIPVDPAAGRAPRDAMLPCFEGLDRWLPRFVREELKELIDDTAITVEQIALDDAEVKDQWVLAKVNRRWNAGSPLRRAAYATLAHLEKRGVDLHAVHLHGRDLDRPVTPCYIGFQLRYLRSIFRCFNEYDGAEWIEVPHPTGSGPILALRILPDDRHKLANREWQPARFFN